MSLLADVGEFEQGGEALNKDTSLLAKVHGWLEAADSPADAFTAVYSTEALAPGAVQACRTTLASELLISIPLQL
jgi:hypothetical protein